MQIVSFADNLHEMSKHIFGKKYKKKNGIVNVPSAELARKVVKVKHSFCLTKNVSWQNETWF